MINISTEDINRTYTGGYIGLNFNGVVEPIMIDGADGRNTLQYVLGGERGIISINDHDVVLSFPDSGVYQINKDKAVYVARSAQRQWHRSIRRSSVNVSGDGEFSDRVVRAMFNPSYRSWNQILDDVTGRYWKSSAIDRNFWLRKMSNAQYPVLFFRDRPIGELVDGSVNIDNQELAELFMEAINGNS